MARMRALSIEDEADLCDLWPKLGTKRCAEHFGCSQNTIKRAVTRLGLRDGPRPHTPRKKPKTREAPAPEEEDIGRLPKLHKLEALLSQQLTEAPPGAVAALSKEYRAVLAEIEQEEDGGDDDDPFELLAASIASKLHS